MAVFLKEKVSGSLIENDGVSVETSFGFDFVLGSHGGKNGIVIISLLNTQVGLGIHAL